MTQLARHVGPDTDVPAGDIGVGTREIAYLFGQYPTITGRFSGVLTGKDPVMGGNCFREEATGYGSVYFAEQVLQNRDQTLVGKRCAVSGSGNMALHTAEKLIESGARVISLSDRGGTLYFSDGLTEEQLGRIKQHKAEREPLGSLAGEEGWELQKNAEPWSLQADLAFACATQSELDAQDAGALIGHGVEAVFEGANMPCTPEAVERLRSADVIFAPSKAVNAGGVAVSGLEITQNQSPLSWTGGEVDNKLRKTTNDIHDACAEHGQTADGIDYKKGANIAAFVELSKAIELYGLT